MRRVLQPRPEFPRAITLVVGLVAALLMFGFAQQLRVEQLLAKTETMREGQALTYLVERTAQETQADALKISVLEADLKTPVPVHQSLRMLQAARRDAGLTAVRGAGVVVTLADDPHPTFPGEPAQMQLVHDEYVLHIVGLLMAHGARAVSISGQRFVAVSAVFCAGPTIRVNNVLEGSPFVVAAVGNAQTMLAALQSDPDVQGWSALVQIRIHAEPAVVVPAYHGPLAFAFARPVAENR